MASHLETLDAGHLDQFGRGSSDDLHHRHELSFELFAGDAGFIEVADQGMLDGQGLAAVIAEKKSSFHVGKLQSADGAPQLIAAGGRPHEAESIERGLRLEEKVSFRRLLDDMDV